MSASANGFTLEELLISRMAKEHRGEILAVGATICSALAVQLAKATHAPELLVMSDTGGYESPTSPSITLAGFIGADRGKGRMSWEELFAIVFRHKFSIWVGPVQIDKHGNSNISAIGDWSRPTAVLIGARGLPDDSVALEKMLYHVVSHSPKSFVEKVDFVCGVGYGPAREEAGLKYGEPGLVVSNLGVFDFDADLKTMRLQSVHPGVTVEQVQKSTGFELVIPAHVPETEPPTREEVELIRTKIDPLGIRRLQHADRAQAMAIRLEIMARERELLTYAFEPAG